MYEVNQLAIQIAIQALENYDLVEDYITEVKWEKIFFLTKSRELGFKSIDTHTNFVHVDLGDHYHEIRDRLKEENILVKGGLPVKGFEKFCVFLLDPRTLWKKLSLFLSPSNKCNKRIKLFQILFLNNFILNDKNEIIIWDLEGYPSRKQNSSVFLWQNYGSKDKAKFISIPQFIEENSKELRDRYLSWVQKFGEEPIGSKKIFENFYIRDNFSFWWMTGIVEKNNWGNHLNK